MTTTSVKNLRVAINHTRKVATGRTTATVLTTPSPALFALGNQTDNGLYPANLTPLAVGTQDFTFGIYCNLLKKTTTQNSDNHCLVDCDLNFGTNLGYAFYATASSGAITMFMGNTEHLSTTGLFTYNTWNWLFFTLQAGTIAGYVNTIPVSLATGVTRLATSGSNFQKFLSENIGQTTGGRHAYGYVSQMFSVRSLLNSTQIASIVNNNVFPAGLDIHYLMNEGNGFGVRDISGNSNHGLINASSASGGPIATGVWVRTGRTQI